MCKAGFNVITVSSWDRSHYREACQKQPQKTQRNGLNQITASGKYSAMAAKSESLWSRETFCLIARAAIRQSTGLRIVRHASANSNSLAGSCKPVVRSAACDRMHQVGMLGFAAQVLDCAEPAIQNFEQPVFNGGGLQHAAVQDRPGRVRSVEALARLDEAAGRVLWLEGIGANCWREWRDFLRRYSHAISGLPARRARP